MNRFSALAALVALVLVLAAAPGAQAQVGIEYALSLVNGCSGANEAPPGGPVSTTATCTFSGKLSRPSTSSTSWTLDYTVTFGTLKAPISGAHIHTGSHTASSLAGLNARGVRASMPYHSGSPGLRRKPVHRLLRDTHAQVLLE
jgi:hypothetical protein